MVAQFKWSCAGP